MTGFIAMLVATFALDRAAKTIAFRESGARRRLAGLLTIRPVRNVRPLAWPRGSRSAWVLAYGAGLGAAVLFVLLEPSAATLTRLGLGAALGGALGNLYDRLVHGAVLDFLDLGRGGVFNPADAALVLGLATALGTHFAPFLGLMVKGSA